MNKFIITISTLFCVFTASFAVTRPTDGYYYIKDGNGKYLYNDRLNHDLTQTSENKVDYDNGYVWKIISNDEANIVILNGEGNGYNGSNKIDISNKEYENWQFEEYDGVVSNVSIQYAIFGEYIEMVGEYLTFNGNNVAFNGGFVVYKESDKLNVSVYEPSYNVFESIERKDGTASFNGINGKVSPDGTKWSGIRTYTKVNNGDEISLYYFTEKDEEMADILYERIMYILFVDFDKVGYTPYMDVFETTDENAMDMFGYLSTGEPYEYKYILGKASDYIKGLDIIQPEVGDAYHIAVRSSKDYSGAVKYYLKSDNTLTTDINEADVFVLGNSNSSDNEYLLVSNNNETLRYISGDGSKEMKYDEDKNAISLTLMTNEGGNNVNWEIPYLYGTFKIKTAEGKVLSLDEENSAWYVSNDAYMNGAYSSAIELIPVDYPFNKVKMTSGNDGIKYIGNFATIYLPYPMIIPDNVEVYSGTEERKVLVKNGLDENGNTVSFEEPQTITFLVMKEVNPTDEGVIPAGGYVLYSKGGDAIYTVLPANGYAEPISNNVFVGSTEYPSTGDVEMWENKMKDNNPYVLGKKSKGIGFYKYTDNKYPKGKAVYMASNENKTSLVMMNFDETVTDIANISKERHGNNNYYDLQGRKINNANNVILILNNRKIIIDK